ncbi:MAG: FemAB family XrtA/PEP-CTERM system-associated protein [Tistlia sp.]|uniref:FemAB family XrtA/PEP-CTERM system-associated protein n=1 Tax=Tistlia sp. TaxID=3057121 RepID=UPI0034A47785
MLKPEMPPAASATPPALRVRAAEAADRPRWDDFVEGCEEATFFHRFGWSEVVRKAHGHRTWYLLAEREEAIEGVLPLVLVSSPIFGKALISTGFTVGGGIAAASDPARRLLAERAAEIGRERGVDYVELRSETAVLDDWLVKDGTYAVFRRPLAEDDEENLKAIPRKKRADVRKAIKSDLSVEIDAPVAEVYALYAESLRNHGTPVFSQRFVEAILEEFPDATELSLIRKDGEGLASLLSFFFRDQVLPYFAGATPAARGHHAFDYLYWTLMQRAAARGVRIFDFGRSKTGTGSYDYKRFWGFEPQPLSYQYHLVRARALPDVNPLNPKYRMMVRTWQHLPLWLSRRVGPLVARQLG